MVWEFKNLGFGNRGLVTQRRGEQRQALVELYRTQDMVAAEVAQAHAQTKAAAIRVARAEAGLKAAVLSYDGNLKGLSQTVRAGELLQLVNRPQEVVAALQQLQQAYISYYTSANDVSRAQFRLFRAWGIRPRGWPAAARSGPPYRSILPARPRWPRSTPRSRALNFTRIYSRGRFGECPCEPLLARPSISSTVIIINSVIHLCVNPCARNTYAKSHSLAVLLIQAFAREEMGLIAALR